MGANVVKQTGSFVVRDQNGQQYAVHELTSMIVMPPAVGETQNTVKEGEKQYELPDSPGTINRLDGNTFEITFPFARTVTASVM